MVDGAHLRFQAVPPRTLRTLAAVVVEAARPDRAEAMAELELWTLAARDDWFRAELDRYNNRRIWPARSA